MKAAPLINIGSIYHSRHQIEKARSYYKEALTIAQAVSYKKREGEALASLGLVYVDLHNYFTAIQYQL